MFKWLMLGYDGATISRSNDDDLVVYTIRSPKLISDEIAMIILKIIMNLAE